MLQNRRPLLLALIATLIIIGAAIYIFYSTPALHGAVITPPAPMPDFTLQSDHGPVSLSDFRGKFIVLYFGYTACPDVCPTTLANLSDALRKLGNKADQVQIIFISVDWKRDTPQKLATYSKAFYPTFIGVTGTQSQIDKTTKDFGISYKFEVNQVGFYSVEHTATTLVLDRQRNLVLTWPYGTSPDDILSDLKVLTSK